MTLRPGTRLRAAVGGAEVILLKDCPGELECAGQPLEVIFSPAERAAAEKDDAAPTG